MVIAFSILNNTRQLSHSETRPWHPRKLPPARFLPPDSCLHSRHGGDHGKDFGLDCLADPDSAQIRVSVAFILAHNDLE